MNFLIFLLTIMIMYCLYEVDKLKKKMMTVQQQDQDIDKDKVFFERLTMLIGKTCELQFKEWNVYVVGTTYTLRAIVEDVDRDWVLIKLAKSKKQEKVLIRLNSIKAVNELHT